MSAVRYARQRECAHPTDPPDPRSANERVQQAMARTTSTSLPACIANRDILFWHCSLRCGRARHCTHAAALARQMVMAEVQRPSACQRGRIWRPVAPSGQSGGGRRRAATPFGRAKGRPPENDASRVAELGGGVSTIITRNLLATLTVGWTVNFSTRRSSNFSTHTRVTQ